MNNKHISKGDQKQVNVIVIGANGQIGQEVVKQLKEKGKFNVKAAIRKEVQKENLNHLDIETVMLNLESSVDELASAIVGNDIVVFTAGSGGSTGYDKTLLIDLDGAIKAIEAAEQSGVKQFIMVSAYGADKRETWADSIKPYYVAKYYADKALLNSSLAYTILHPTALSNSKGTGKVSLHESSKEIPRQDVACVIAEVAGNEKAYRKSLNLFAGETAICDIEKEL